MLKPTKTIAKLERELIFRTGEFHAKTGIIENKLKANYLKLFEKQLKSEINKAFASLDRSNEYCYDKHGEIQHWVYAIELLNSIPETAKEFFEEYIGDNHCAYIDWDNRSIYYLNHGDIIINDEGDVLDSDSGKWIIKRDDYRDDDGNEDESKRNQLIEAYMERTGCYPGVFSVDRHGNIFPVSTVAQK